MKKLLLSFTWAKNGLRTVWFEERNFRIEISIGLIVILFGIFSDLSRIDWALLWIAIVMVLCSEIINTAFEDICNKIEPKNDPVIGKIKDIMAGFVSVSCIGAVFIGIIVFF